MDNEALKSQLEEIEHIKKVREIAGKIADIKIAMMSTISDKGAIHSRPMYTTQIQDNGAIYFLAAKNCRKNDEIKANQHVNLTYVDGSKNLYASVCGVASLDNNLQKIDELWNESYKAWFPEGKTDPNISLIRIDIEEAEYWDAPDSIIGQIIGVAKATLAGNPYKVGENKKIDL